MLSPFNKDTYQWFLETPSRKHWDKIGLGRRAGVAIPLFSLYSKESVGIGELPDLEILIDWCEQTKLSIIQLLPLNDTGYNFTPYDARSMFALDPMYLRIQTIHESQVELFQNKITDLANRFPAGNERVNYDIKREKMKLLFEIYKQSAKKELDLFVDYKMKNQNWLKPYALFSYYKELYDEKAWWEWPTEIQQYADSHWKKLTPKAIERIEFHQWLQWQLSLQMVQVKAKADQKNILFMGDIPFLVSRDSADVWANQNYFKLELSAGAPPDLYFADGQNWGMPPYHWEAIAHNGYDYLVEKLRYAESFYHLFRIDHFVGMFRIWTIDPKTQKGAFDPCEEHLWEEHGKKLLNVMLDSTMMLPCAEDLGTVPDCSYRTLREYGLVGMDVQRWQRWWGETNDYKNDKEYRPNAIAVISTHDMVDLKGWWEYEIGSVDEKGFRYKCMDRGLDPDDIIPKLFDTSRTREGRIFWDKSIDHLDKFLAVLQKPADHVQDFIGMFRETATEKAKFWQHIGMTGELRDELDPEIAKKIIAKANATVSIFSVQLLQDWLAVTDLFQGKDPIALRINRPGTVGRENWSVVLPISLEKLLQLQQNKVIKDLIVKSGRN